VSQRRAARVLALQCLHTWEAQGPDTGRGATDDVIARLSREEDVRDYCRGLLEAYWDHAIAIDEKITTCAEHWSLDRMAVVDRNVLRLAVTELLHFPDVPPKVVIDEAIEIAKRFSTERSGAFINGILDKVLTEREEAHGAG
jgi:transcription antitermination factor NusB